jgi:hypothetical protein
MPDIEELMEEVHRLPLWPAVDVPMKPGPFQVLHYARGMPIPAEKLTTRHRLDSRTWLK